MSVRENIADEEKVLRKMPLRFLLRYLANEHLVEALANSYPIRRLAQLTHYTYRRVTLWGNETLDKAVKTSETSQSAEGKPPATQRLTSVARNFARNLQKEIEKSQVDGRNRP